MPLHGTFSHKTIVMNQITLLCLSFVMTAIIACSKANSSAQADSPAPTTATASDPQGLLSETPVKAEDEPLNKNAWLAASQQHLTRWFTYHQKAIKDFSVHDFVVLDTFHEVDFTALEVTEVDPALAKYRFPSPNGKMQLDIYAYGKQLLPDKQKAGQFELAAQSLESEVALYGMAVNKKLRLLFCSDECHFEDAAWVNNDMIVVAGTSTETDKKNHPMIWGIKLSTKSVYRFIHPAEVTERPISFFNAVIVSR